VKTDWSVDADVLMSERLFKTSSAESDVSKMIVVMRSACSQIVAWMGLAYEQQRRASSVQEELPSNVRELHAARRQASNVTPLSTGPILVWSIGVFMSPNVGSVFTASLWPETLARGP